jgi:hypothetical protein
VLADLAEPADAGLDAALGAGPATRLRELLAWRAVEWAIATASPGRAFASNRLPGVASGAARPFAEPPGDAAKPAGNATEPLGDAAEPAGHATEPAVLAAALEAALAGHHGPVLLVAPDVPRLDAKLAEAAIGDLQDGCLAALAPAQDGRAFLLALADARPGLLELAATRPGRPELSRVAELSDGEPLAIGLLRGERRLVSAHDARALAADPLAPPDLAPLVALARA